jgi:N-acetylglucosaminyldiphosphoundecaprenol N-acetyl-beta-D-mannosaminyltransferase
MYINGEEMQQDRTAFMGVPVDAITMKETIARIHESIVEGDKIQHMAINTMIILRMVEDPEFMHTLSNCEVINADGIGVVWASKLLGKPLPERVTGIDLMEALIGLAAEQGMKPYFLGAQEEVVQRTVSHYRRQYPNIEIAGYRNGYFTDEDEQQIAEDIRDSGADMLFVAISSPKKEIFLGRWRETMDIAFCMGVGGSFDVVAGKFKRAPEWVQRAGLEWVYRWKQEPRRMLRRNAIDMPKFVAMVLASRILGLEVPQPSQPSQPSQEY